MKPKIKTAEKVYNDLKLMAMTYEFRPGERINENQLADELGVSRTPIREALNRLSSEGFVSISSNRGFVGRSLNAQEIFELFEFRSILEQAIIRLACQRATDEEMQELKTFVLEAEERWQGRATLESFKDSEEFHVRVARMTHNSELVRALEGINLRIYFVRWIDWRMRPKAHLQDKDLLDYLLLRDADGAAKMIDRIIKRRVEEINEVIRSGIADIYLGSQSDS